MSIIVFMEILRLLAFSGMSVLYLFVISKILGKKQIAQLEFIDYAIGISIGSISAEMATDLGENPFYYYLIAISVFVIFDMLVTFLGRKTLPFKKFFKGKPIIVINNGEIDFGQLKISKLDFFDLLSLCRQQGYFDIKNVAFAIFEPNGKLSVMPKSDQKPVVANDIKINPPKAKLIKYLIVDGEIIKENLRAIKKDKKWLFEKLKIKKSKQLKNILWASYDKTKQKILIENKHKNSDI